MNQVCVSSGFCINVAEIPLKSDLSKNNNNLVPYLSITFPAPPHSHKI